MTLIQIKKISDKVLIPKYETSGSSGMDISAFTKEDIIIEPGQKALIPTGFALSIPKGYEIQIRPRSGLAAKHNLSVLNTPGTIDSDYRGEIKVILMNFGKERFVVQNGARIAQMVMCPIIQAKLEVVKDLIETDRGDGGFGSTGTK